MVNEDEDEDEDEIDDEDVSRRAPSPQGEWTYGAYKTYSARIDNRGKAIIQRDPLISIRASGNPMVILPGIVDELNFLYDGIRRLEHRIEHLQAADSWNMQVYTGRWHPADTEKGIAPIRYTLYIFASGGRNEQIEIASDVFDDNKMQELTLLFAQVSKANLRYQPSEDETESSTHFTLIANGLALAMFARGLFAPMHALMVLGMLNTFSKYPDFKGEATP